MTFHVRYFIFVLSLLKYGIVTASYRIQISNIFKELQQSSNRIRVGNISNNRAATTGYVRAVV